MEQRALQVELVSAKDLKYVNYFSKMDVYAVVSILGDTYNGNQKTKTKLVRDGGTNPTFNFPMRFTVDDYLTQHNNLSLAVKLVSDRTLGNKTIGVVVVPIKELFDYADHKNMTSTSYQVRRPSGRPQGELSFSYRFGEKVAAPGPRTVNKGEPVTAYPVGYPQQATSSSGLAYPPAQSGYPYAPPPQQGYVVQQVQQPKPANKRNGGLGAGAGLFGGILGGMVLADVMTSGGCGGGGCGGGGCGGGGCGGGCGG